jgi:hypothetical protein
MPNCGQTKHQIQSDENCGDRSEGIGPENHEFATANSQKDSHNQNLCSCEVSLEVLKTLDQSIRALIDQTLAVNSIPVECHPCSWREAYQGQAQITEEMYRQFAHSGTCSCLRAQQDAQCQGNLSKMKVNTRASPETRQHHSWTGQTKDSRDDMQPLLQNEDGGSASICISTSKSRKTA